MPELLLHPKTRSILDQMVSKPPQAILVVGKGGAGKETVASYLAARLLEVAPETLASNPYYMSQGADEGAISIDAVRDIQHFLSRKTTNGSAVNRIASIVNAERLTPEAQNAFLKTLEEPPVGSVLLLTVTDKQRLLPTVLSRVQALEVLPPDTETVRNHFANAGHSGPHIDRALLMSGGLPGLMTALLAGDSDHPLVQAATIARTILRLDTFGRLALIDTFAKQRQQCFDILYILQQMAELSLRGNAKSAAVYGQWQTVLRQAYTAEEALRTQAQPKLVLTHLMLSL